MLVGSPEFREGMMVLKPPSKFHFWTANLICNFFNKLLRNLKVHHWWSQSLLLDFKVHIEL